MSPRSSATISRSASPSSAIPISARRASTSRRICSGASAPQSRLMLSPSGDTPMREHLGAKFPEHRRGDLVGGAVRAIDDDAQPVEPQPARKALLDELDVAAAGVVESLGAAELGRRPRAGSGPLARCSSILSFEFVGQLVPVAPEQLDAVVGVRVVRRRDDDADIGAQAARQHRDRRGRQRPDQHDIHAHRDETRRSAPVRACSPIAACPCRSRRDACVSPLWKHSPTAIATLSAVSGVIGSLFAVPRIPSVPNSLRVILSYPPIFWRELVRRPAAAPARDLSVARKAAPSCACLGEPHRSQDRSRFRARSARP